MDIMIFLDSAGLAESTIENYTYALELWELWWLLNDPDEEFDPCDVPPGMILFFLDMMGWTNNRTRRAYLAPIKSIFRFTYGKRHPVARMKLRYVDPGEQRTLTPEQEVKVLQCLNPSRPVDLRMTAMYRLMKETALRSSETCRLRVQDVDLDDCKLSVIQKRGRLRYAVFSKTTRRYLKRWFRERKKHAAPGVDTVFVSIGGIRPGQPLTRDGMRSIFRRLGKQAGIGLISPHDLRRTFATDCVRRNISTKLIMTQGGWKSAGMVFRYSQAIRVEAFRGYFGDNTDVAA